MTQCVSDVRRCNAVSPAHAGGERGIADHVITNDREKSLHDFTRKIEFEGSPLGSRSQIKCAHVARIGAGAIDGGLAMAGDAIGKWVVGIQNHDSLTMHIGGK